MSLQLVRSDDQPRLAALLKDADEDVARIALNLAESTNTAYLAFDDAVCVGALLICWQREESELLYLAIEEPFRGHGYGKSVIAQVITEARQRNVHSLIVGTANSSLDNIAFYQKCGFRMDSVRKDYFDYLSAPVYENGLRVQDMLVFRYEIPS